MVEVEKASSERRPAFRENWVPTPDPTALTTDQLRREITSTRELFESRLNAMDKAIILLQTAFDRQPPTAVLLEKIQALDGTLNERILTLSAELTGDVTTAVETSRKEVGETTSSHLAMIERNNAETTEKFESIKAQFVEKDKATDRLGLADKAALAAALLTQKESAAATNEGFLAALAKMENNFTKQLDQMVTIVNSIKANADEKIQDIKGRLDRGEGRTSVSDPALTEAMHNLNSTVSSLRTSRDGSEAIGGNKAIQTGFLISSVIAGAAALSFVYSVVTHNPAPSGGSAADQTIARMALQNADAIARVEQRLNQLGVTK